MPWKVSDAALAQKPLSSKRVRNSAKGTNFEMKNPTIILVLDVNRSQERGSFRPRHTNKGTLQIGPAPVLNEFSPNCVWHSELWECIVVCSVLFRCDELFDRFGLVARFHAAYFY
jgi:hypothetical protein